MKSVQTLRVTGWMLLALGTLLSPSFADDLVVEFPPPPIHPAGAELETRELAPGVYALVSTKPPVDNSGFVVGQRGVLVIDAHINKTMAEKIQKAVREVTDKPILYLVNTTYHGDHTFGNYAFPSETLIIAHRNSAEKMKEFEREKKFLLPTVNNDPDVYGDVELRLPDITYTDSLQIDLGGRLVEIRYFGHGNGPGDSVVYVPDSQVAWTGNLVLGPGTVPFLIEGGAGAYLETIARFSKTLDVKTIIPGHGFLTDGKILGRYSAYLSDLVQSMRESRRAGLSLREALSASPLGKEHTLPSDSPLAAFLLAVHRWNVKMTYEETKTS